MIKEIFEVSKVAKPRTVENVFLSLVEEVGELSTELSINAGHSDKKRGKDGVVGEAIDVILCAVDLIWVRSGNVGEEFLEGYITGKIKEKLEKWRAKHDSSNSGEISGS